MTSKMERGSVLNEAHRVITQDRQDQYGNAEDSFKLIAELWSPWLGITVSGYDVAMMMALLKVARARGNPGQLDNFVDGAGYLALAAEQVAA